MSKASFVVTRSRFKAADDSLWQVGATGYVTKQFVHGSKRGKKDEMTVELVKV